MGGNKSQVSGYRYFMGLHFGLCHTLAPYSGATTPDGLLEIRAGDRTAWSGVQSASGQISIDSPTLFGGDQKEGGIQGVADVMLGEPTQAVNAYLLAQQGSPQPAYRGVSTLVYEGGLVGSNNPYPKAWSFRVRRTTAGWSGGVPWYPAKAAITMSNGAVGMNPAHIAYEVITNPDWGMGYPSGQIDTVSFQAAADQLYSESFGLCLLWNRQDTIENFLQDLMDYIGGVLVSSPTTGLFQLNLIRGGYDPSTLPVFTADDVIEVVEKSDSTITGCTNEMVIRYYDPTLKNPQSAIIQALGAIQAQGVVVSSVKDYPGIPTGDLAARVAQRELAAVSIPLKRIQMKFNRKLWKYTPGQLFVLNMPQSALSGIVFRIGELDLGTLTSGAITVTAIQDTFSLPSDTYITVQTSGWVIPNPNPVPPTVYHGFDAGYRDLLQQLGSTDTAALPAGTSYAGIMIQRPNGLQYSFNIYSAPPPYSDFEPHGTGHFTPAATVQAALNPFDTGCTFLGISDPTLISDGMAAMIIDGSSFEVIRIDAINTSTGVATIARGCLDTVPASHPAGVRVFFFDTYAASDGVEYTAGETVEFKPLTNASNGTLDISLAPVVSAVLIGRSFLPYPPQSLAVNGTRWDLLGATTQTDLSLSWFERNRVVQAEDLIDTTAGTVSPEAGQTYQIDLYDASGANFATFTGITGTGWTWTPRDSTHLAVSAKVTAMRGGLAALQAPTTAIINLLPPAPTVPTYRIAGAYAGLFVLYKITPPTTIDYYDSPDGLTWTHHADPGVPSSQFPDESTWLSSYLTGGKIYANQNGSGTFWTSDDANWYDTPWTKVAVSGFQASGVTLQNGQWIAFQAYSGAQPQIATSPDYATWTLKTLGLPYGSGIFSYITGIWWDSAHSRYSVATTYEDRTGSSPVRSARFYTTPDLVTFTEIVGARTAVAQLFAAAQNGSTIVAVGSSTSSNTPTVWVSTDAGTTWSASTPTVPSVTDGTHTSSTFAMVSAVFDGTDFVIAGFGYTGKSTTGSSFVFTATGQTNYCYLYANASGNVLRQDANTPGLLSFYTSTDHGVTWSFQYGPDFTGVNSTWNAGTGGNESPLLIGYDGAHFQVGEFGSDTSGSATAIYDGNAASLTYINKAAGTPGAIGLELSEFPEGSAFGGGLYFSFRKDFGFLTTVPSLGSWSVAYGSALNALTVATPAWFTGAGEYPMACCWDGTNFCVLGTTGSGAMHAYTTPDGFTWTTVGAVVMSGAAWTDATGSPIVPSYLTRCRMRKIGSYYYLLMGGDSWGASAQRLLRSTDLMNWTLCPGTNLVTPYNYWRLYDFAVTADGTLVLLGFLRSATDGILKYALLVSTDGFNFAVVYVTPGGGYGYLQTVGSGGHEVVAMGGGGTLYTTGHVTVFNTGTLSGAYPYRPIGNGSRVLARRDTGSGSAVTQLWYTDDGNIWSQTTGL